MSVVPDTSSNSTYKTATTGYTWSHTCNGSNRLLLVGIMYFTTGYSPGSTVTYNGVSMSLVEAVSYNNLVIEFYSRLNPASGTNTISFTSIYSACDSIGLAVSFVDVNQVYPGGNTTNYGTGTDSGSGTASVSLTGYPFRHYLLGWFLSTDPDGVTLVAGTQLEQVSGASGLAALAFIGPRLVASGNIVYSGINSGSDWILYCVSVFDIFNPVWGQRANKIIHGVSA